ncbi:redoxin domain-containing protein [Rhodopirellula sp. JC639]|uniref:redoxin domain-containing protein n=1 Tax=Stieleria mannarensis TaxID=2755585 RepID=UPI00336AA776
MTTALFAGAHRAARAQSPTAAQALALKPLQPDATYEIVPAEKVAKCTVNDITVAGQNGWEVVAPDGQMLRRFVDTNGDKKIDLWSYFNYGVEAYRDIDADFNGKADQYRWLGNSGTRWGLDQDEDGRIDSWRRISAEEVSAEVVAALREKDPRRFARLLATPSELEALGLGEAKLAELEMKAKLAARNFAELAKDQTAIGPETEWLQFAAPAPGLVPEGTGGSTKDVVVYENVVAMYENGGQSGQLMVGTLVQVDDRWRMVTLPNVGGQDGALTQTGGLFFTPGGVAMAAMPSTDSGLQDLVTQLESLDQKLASAGEAGLPALHAARAELVEKLITASGNDEDRATWTRQLVDTVSVAVQSGQYPKGLDRLKSVSDKFARSNEALAAYADYQAIQAEYFLKQTPDADFEKVQTWYLQSLADFVDSHPRTLEAAQAMLQLALAKEFEDKEKDALAYYRKVRDGYKGTEAGEKAAGAVRRLESVGRKIELEGATLDGKTFKLSALRGRPVVIHYWATWCEPCKQDMKLLSRLQGRYKRQGLTLVGINVDARRADAEGFVRENRLPWIQLFEEGGLESSRLSKAFGVQTLPTMMLVDKDGTVVRHNVRAAELDAAIEEMVK